MGCFNTWCILLCCLVVCEIGGMFFSLDVFMDISQIKYRFQYIVECSEEPLVQSSLNDVKDDSLLSTDSNRSEPSTSILSSQTPLKGHLSVHPDSELTESASSSSSHVFQLVLFTTEDVGGSQWNSFVEGFVCCNEECSSYVSSVSETL